MDLKIGEDFKMPIPDYRLNVQDPSASFTRGMGISNVIADRRRLIEQQKTAALQQQELNQAVANLGPESTVDDYVAVSNMLAISNPEASAALLENFERQSAPAKQETLNFLGQVITALKTKPEMAERMLKEREEAYRNSGDEANAQAMSNAIELAGESPEAGIETLAGLMAGLPGGEKKMRAMGIFGKEERAKALAPGEIKLQLLDIAKGGFTIDKLIADTELTRAKTETEKLMPDKIRNDMSGVGDLSTKDRSDLENKYYDRYVKQIQPYYVARQQYDKLLASSQQGTGVGDLALIFGFMRMLDPGSVVRESEFARAAATGGLMRQLMVLGYKIEKGELLEQSQRKEFAELAKIYMEAAENNARKDYIDLRSPVEDFNLSVRHVFGYDPLGMGMHQQSLSELEKEYESGKISARFDLDKINFGSKGGIWGGSDKGDAAIMEAYLDKTDPGWRQDDVLPDATNTSQPSFLNAVRGD